MMKATYVSRQPGFASEGQGACNVAIRDTYKGEGGDAIFEAGHTPQRWN